MKKEIWQKIANLLPSVPKANLEFLVLCLSGDVRDKNMTKLYILTDWPA